MGWDGTIRDASALAQRTQRLAGLAIARDYSAGDAVTAVAVQVSEPVLGTGVRRQGEEKETGPKIGNRIMSPTRLSPAHQIGCSPRQGGTKPSPVSLSLSFALFQVVSQHCLRLARTCTVPVLNRINYT